MSEEIPAAWYPDPDDNGASLRWWDGSEWTEETRPAATASRPRPTPGTPSTAQPTQQPIPATPPASAPQAPQPPPYGPPRQRNSNWFARHKGLTALAVVAAVIIAAVAASSSGGGSKAPITGQQATNGTTGGSQSRGKNSSGQQGSSAAVGKPLTVTGNGGLKATVTAVSVKAHTTPADTTVGQPPANGSYQVADVSIQVTSGQYAFNTLYFKYQTADGRTYDAFDGNATSAGYEPGLSAGDLNAGQTTRGNVVFDVPPGGRDIQLTDPLGTVVGQWNLQ